MTLCLTRRCDETRALRPDPGVTAQFACYSGQNVRVTAESAQGTTQTTLELSTGPINQPFNAVVELNGGSDEREP